MAVSAVMLAAVAVGVLAFPQPLFAYHVEYGQLQLWSDQPFDERQGRRVLADIAGRIEASPLALGENAHRIFVANTEWRRLVFLWNYGAGGVNYYPLRNVFIRQSDIDGNRVLRDAGPVPLPRTLAYFGAHEIGHSLIGEKIGMLANWRLPVWIREGLADYVGFGREADIDALTKAFLAEEPDLDPRRSGLYARYRLLVAYMIKHEGWSVERLLGSQLSQDEAERRLLARYTRAISQQQNSDFSNW
ncbi:MAG: hypothetical protein RO009_24085 [Pseudorhodoplanes sp.]|jgi:hypothetical protein|nr:hypothetical protein [Pseudorhodoplanes sp.]